MSSSKQNSVGLRQSTLQISQTPPSKSNLVPNKKASTPSKNIKKKPEIHEIINLEQEEFMGTSDPSNKDDEAFVINSHDVGVVIGEEVRGILQLDKPGGLLNFRGTTLEKQNDGRRGPQVSGAEYRRAPKDNRQGLENYGAINQIGRFILI